VDGTDRISVDAYLTTDLEGEATLLIGEAIDPFEFEGLVVNQSVLKNDD